MMKILDECSATAEICDTLRLDNKTSSETMSAFEAMVWVSTRSETILKTIRAKEKPRTDMDRGEIALDLGQLQIMSFNEAHVALCTAISLNDLKAYGVPSGKKTPNPIQSHIMTASELNCINGVLAGGSTRYTDIYFDYNQVFETFPPLPRSAIISDGDWVSLHNVISYFVFDDWETYRQKSEWLNDFTLNPAHPKTGRLPVIEFIDPEHLPEGYETQLCDHHSSCSILFKIRNKLPASGRKLLKDYVRTRKQWKKDKPPERDDIYRAIDQAIKCFSNPALQGGVATRGVDVKNGQTQSISSKFWKDGPTFFYTISGAYGHYYDNDQRLSFEFRDIEVNAEHFRRWAERQGGEVTLLSSSNKSDKLNSSPNDLKSDLKEDSIVTPPKKVKLGRPKGSGAIDDTEFVEEMREAIQSGRANGASNATLLVAERAGGFGGFESKRRRLRSRYRETYGD